MWKGCQGVQRWGELGLPVIVQQPSIFICYHLRTLPRGQHFNMFPRTHRSISRKKIPITYPAASTTKIGVTVTMLTSIVDGCFSGSFETTNCLKILFWIPLSRNCANLWRKLYYIKSLIHCHFKRILTNILQLWLYKIKRQNIGE
jgi:hypothetical protein